MTGQTEHAHARRGPGFAAQAAALACIAAAVVAGTLSGCGSTPKASAEGGARAGVTKVAGETVLLIPGRPFVITLEPGELPPETRGTTPPPPLLARIGSTEVPMRVVRIGISPWNFGVGDTCPDRWLPNPGVWSAGNATGRDQESAARGSIAAIGTAPPRREKDDKDGLIDIGSRSLPAAWVTFDTGDQTEQAATPGPEQNPWASPLSMEARNSLAGFQPLLGNDPLERWRWRLGMGTLSPETRDGLATIEDPALESVAAWTEDRWRLAILNVWRRDRALSSRLTARLCSMAQATPAAWWPAWTTDRGSLESLVRDLTSQAVPDDRKIEITEAWLRDQPMYVAWVIDDAAGLTPDAAGSDPIAEIGVVNLTDRATLGWASERDGSRSDQLKPIPAGAFTPVRTLPPPAEVKGPAGRPVTLHAGSWERELLAAAQPAGVTPPGLTIGPLLDDWSLATWHGGKPSTPATEWSTAALVHRPVGIAGETKWQVFVECRSVPGVGKASDESVRIAFGSAVAPLAIYRVGIDGRAINELGSRGGEPVVTVPVTKGRDRWSFRLDIPPSAIEQGGLLRIGLTRTDALGRRSAWPRPMTPWQAQPGRALLDLKAWR